jgi:hypothetical protein
MKMKLRPTTFALFEPEIGMGTVNVVEPKLEFDRTGRTSTAPHAFR